jgi:ribosome-associated toxin RatA of RatAB toxin-antitoxin module
VIQRARRSVVVDARPEDVFGVVADVERYPEWTDEFKSVVVIERDAAGRPLEVTFRAAAFGRSTTYTLRYDYERAPHEIAWHQVEGDLTSVLEGRYRFDAAAGGTRVTYDLAVELRVPIPSFVRSRAAARIQSQALGELRARVEAR